jgi:hypothetical protein
LRLAPLTFNRILIQQENVWRPDLSESIDGKFFHLLATSISDLLLDFPYDHLLPHNFFLSVFLRPESMLALVFYEVSKPLFETMIQRYVDPNASWFIISIAIHNSALALFSAVVAWSSWAIVFQHLQTF